MDYYIVHQATSSQNKKINKKTLTFIDENYHDLCASNPISYVSTWVITPFMMCINKLCVQSKWNRSSRFKLTCDKTCFCSVGNFMMFISCFIFLYFSFLVFISPENEGNILIFNYHHFPIWVLWRAFKV